MKVAKVDYIIAKIKVFCFEEDLDYDECIEFIVNGYKLKGE